MISEKGLNRLYSNGINVPRTILSVKDVITYLQENISHDDLSIEDIPIAMRVDGKEKQKLFIAKEGANPFIWLLQGPTFTLNMIETDLQDMECLKKTNELLTERVKELEEKISSINLILE